MGHTSSVLTRTSLVGILLLATAGCENERAMLENVVDSVRGGPSGHEKELTIPLAYYEGKPSEMMELADTTYKEMVESQKTPAKRRRSDDAMLASMAFALSVVYQTASGESRSPRQKEATELWLKARKLAKTPANAGDEDELLSEPFRAVAFAFHHLYLIACGNPPRGGDTSAKLITEMRAKAAEHEKEDLDGNKSARARALVAEAEKLTVTYKKAIAAVEDETDRDSAMRNDPELLRLQEDYRHLEEKAKIVAHAVDCKTEWYRCKESELNTYKAKGKENLLQQDAIRAKYRRK